MKKFPTSSG